MGLQRVRQDWATFTFQRCILIQEAMAWKIRSSIKLSSIIHPVTFRFSLTLHTLSISKPCWILISKNTSEIHQLLTPNASPSARSLLALIKFPPKVLTSFSFFPSVIPFSHNRSKWPYIFSEYINSIFSIKNNFIELWLYNHSPNLCYTHSHQLQKFPPTLSIYYCYYFVSVCDKNTFVIYPLSRF